jgi:hypothetical protein
MATGEDDDWFGLTGEPPTANQGLTPSLDDDPIPVADLALTADPDPRPTLGSVLSQPTESEPMPGTDSADWAEDGSSYGGTPADDQASASAPVAAVIGRLRPKGAAHPTSTEPDGFDHTETETGTAVGTDSTDHVDPIGDQLATPSSPPSVATANGFDELPYWRDPTVAGPASPASVLLPPLFTEDVELGQLAAVSELLKDSMLTEPLPSFDERFPPERLSPGPLPPLTDHVAESRSRWHAELARPVDETLAQQARVTLAVEKRIEEARRRRSIDRRDR